VIEQEKLILNTLQFNMSVPTPYVFMMRFLKAADSDKQVKCNYILISIITIWINWHTKFCSSLLLHIIHSGFMTETMPYCCISQLELVSFFMLELCLVEYQMLKYQPSLLAAAAVYTAQCAVNRCQHWTKVCESHSKYTGDQLL